MHYQIQGVICRKNWIQRQHYFVYVQCNKIWRSFQKKRRSKCRKKIGYSHLMNIYAIYELLRFWCRMERFQSRGNGKQAHNIAFYYLVSLCEPLDIPAEGEFVSHKDNCNVVIGWMPIEKLQDITIYPEFLKEEIYHLDDGMKHFVSQGQRGRK